MKTADTFAICTDSLVNRTRETPAEYQLVYDKQELRLIDALSRTVSVNKKVSMFIEFDKLLHMKDEELNDYLLANIKDIPSKTCFLTVYKSGKGYQLEFYVEQNRTKQKGEEE